MKKPSKLADYQDLNIEKKEQYRYINKVDVTDIVIYEKPSNKVDSKSRYSFGALNNNCCNFLYGNISDSSETDDSDCNYCSWLRYLIAFTTIIAILLWLFAIICENKENTEAVGPYIESYTDEFTR